VIELGGVRDTLAVMLVVITVFTVTSSYLIALIETETPSGSEQTSPSLVISGVQYTLYDPAAGRQITWANATTSYHPFPSPKAVHFWKPNDSNPFYVTVVRNRTDTQQWPEADEWFKYTDYIGIEKNWGWWGVGRKAVSISDICALHNESPNSNTVTVDFTFDAPYVLIVETADASGFVSDVLVNNTYKLFIGEATFREYGGQSAWDILWNVVGVFMSLFTFSLLPEVPVLSFLISTALWVGVIYVGYTLVQRIWSGGG